MTKKHKNDATDSKHNSWLVEARYGRSISIEFFKSNFWLLTLVVVALLALIGLRYKTKTKMAEIKQLRSQLELAESEKIHEKALYMSMVRESEMVMMVNQKQLNLQFQDKPPYELKRNEK